MHIDATCCCKLTAGGVAQGNMVSLDTRDILFIVGGAFNGLDQQISDRTATASMGFDNPIRSV